MGETADQLMGRAATLAAVTNAMFCARAHAIRRGETDETLAAKLSLSVHEWRERFLFPAGIKIDALSDIFFACDCEIVITAHARHGPEVFTPSGILSASESSDGGNDAQ